MWLSGPVPQDLRLPLTDGSPPQPGLQHLRAMSLPGWGEAPIEDHVALGAALPSHPALSATIGILRARLEEELRHRRGIAYSVQADRIGLSPRARVLALTSDVRPGQARMAAQTLWREVRRLADHGPTGAEIAQERAEVEAYLGDPRSDVDEARALAHAAVTGVPATSAAALQADADALTPDAVKEVAAAVRDATVLLVPEGVEPQLTDLHRLPEWSSAVVSGREFVRKRLRGLPKDARLVVGQEGTSLVLGGDRWITVLWQDAVGLVRQGPDEWALVGRDGFVVQVSGDDWRDGAAAVATIRQAVPPPLQVVDDDILDGGVLIVRAPAHRVSEAIALGTPTAPPWLPTRNGPWCCPTTAARRKPSLTTSRPSSDAGRLPWCYATIIPMSSTRSSAGPMRSTAIAGEAHPGTRSRWLRRPRGPNHTQPLSWQWKVNRHRCWDVPSRCSAFRTRFPTW